MSLDRSYTHRTSSKKERTIDTHTTHPQNHPALTCPTCRFVSRLFANLSKFHRFEVVRDIVCVLMVSSTDQCATGDSNGKEANSVPWLGDAFFSYLPDAFSCPLKLSTISAKLEMRATNNKQTKKRGLFPAELT